MIVDKPKKTYNIIDLSPDDDFVSPFFIKETGRGQNKSYSLHFMPDNDKVRKELQGFLKEHTTLFGLFKIKMGYSKEHIDK